MTMKIARRAALAGIASAAVAFSLTLSPGAATAASAASCTSKPYGYAGLIAYGTAAGVKATISAASVAQVSSGHVAGWIGVGGPGTGANGQDAWIQIGINSVPGTPNTIYVEAWVPGHGQVYTALGQVPVGATVNAAVLELPGKPGVWQATIDGRPVTTPVYLPGSHGSWQPMAVSESWNGGTPVCNTFSYRFGNVRIKAGAGSWKLFAGNATQITDPGYRVSSRTVAGFVAGSS